MAAEKSDVLLQAWHSRWEQIRHSETQRSTITNMVLVLTAAGLGYIAQRGLQPAMLLVSVGIFGIGTFGALLCAKYYERFSLHLREAAAIRAKLDDLMPEAGLKAAFDEASRDHRQAHPMFSKVPLFMLWILLHAGIAAAGSLLTIAILIAG